MKRGTSRRWAIGALSLLGLAGAGFTLARLRGQDPTRAEEDSVPSSDTPGLETADATSAARRLESHVRMLSETLVPRDHEHPENLDRVADYIRQNLKRAGGRITDQPFEVDGRNYRNVVAVYGPETADRLVIGAHYDAAGPYPAADDNASGVAGLLELAERFQADKLPLRVDLVAFTLEEPPYFASDRMGSAIHAASLRKSGAAVRAMISLEMIGFFTDAPNSQEYPDPSLKAVYPSEGNFIAVVGRTEEKRLVERIEKAMRGAAALPVRSLAAPASVPGIGLSDHRSYWDAGYPALMITDTAFYRNPNYHTAKDTAKTLDYDRMAMVVDGVRGAILELSR